MAGQPIDEHACLEKFQQPRHDKEQGYFTLSGQKACGMLEEHLSRQGLPAKPDPERSR